MNRLLLLASGLLAASPLQGEHARSREARAALAAGHPERALEAYLALERELGRRPEVEVGRGASLLGMDRPGEAREAYERARQAPEPLGSRALLGLASARAGDGDLDGAVAACREALLRDPGFADARYDLEVLLRRRAEASGASRPEPDRKPEPSTRGQEGGGAGARGEQGGAEPGAGRRRDPGEGAERERPGAGAAGRGREERREPAGEESGGEPEDRLSREEALRLLDALRARERNLPAAAARSRTARRPDAAKDW